VPSDRKALKDQTLHIRIAGIDAPECAHFGNPAQPFSKEALEWLKEYVNGRTVTIRMFDLDRYLGLIDRYWILT
jgi:endonuclease YncB( thermonuclease family)